MKLKSIKLTRVGPFYHTAEIEIDPRVTILTGANDVGKSSILRSIALAMEEPAQPAPNFINIDHIKKTAVDPSQDATNLIEVTVNVESPSDIAGGSGAELSSGIATIKRTISSINPARKSRIQITGPKPRTLDSSVSIKLPAVIHVDSSSNSELRDVIDCAKLSTLEKGLLDVAFEGRFNVQRFAEMDVSVFTICVNAASEHLNNQVAKLLPISSKVRFHLSPSAGHRDKFSLFIIDSHGAITPFGSRGAGFQKIVRILADLLIRNANAHHRILLLDEPEISLHADAQHLLRDFFYDLTATGKVQVIYATHSSSMVDPLRGEQLRLFQRTTVDGVATSVVVKNPVDANFSKVRTSLGMNAADSLLFAPITLVTEGDTEVECLLQVAEKLASVLPGVDVKRILRSTAVLDGDGDSFEYLCRLAEAHGTKVIVFLDADKSRKLQQMKFAEKHRDVSVIILPGEFEDLLPKHVYLRAVFAVSRQEMMADAEQLLEKWTESNERRKRLTFSSKVERWFTDEVSEYIARKPDRMKHAIEIATPEQIDAAPIANLLRTIEAQSRFSAVQ